jgi:hypothetical protein
MNTSLRSKASSFLLAVIGTALSGMIAAFIVIMIYFANFQIAAADTLRPGDGSSVSAHRPIEKDRCRLQ